MLVFGVVECVFEAGDEVGGDWCGVHGWSLEWWVFYPGLLCGLVVLWCGGDGAEEFGVADF